jgi:hypothetical protein
VGALVNPNWLWLPTVVSMEAALTTSVKEEVAFSLVGRLAVMWSNVLRLCWEEGCDPLVLGGCFSLLSMALNCVKSAGPLDCCVMTALDDLPRSSLSSSSLWVRCRFNGGKPGAL